MKVTFLADGRGKYGMPIYSVGFIKSTGNQITDYCSSFQAFSWPLNLYDSFIDILGLFVPLLDTFTYLFFFALILFSIDLSISGAVLGNHTNALVRLWITKCCTSPCTPLN